MLSAAVSGVRRRGARGPVFLALLCLLLVPAHAISAGKASLAAPDAAKPFSAAGIGAGTRPITGLWQFHLGDDLAWAQPAFDDHSWERLPADQPWAGVGHPGYTGFAWYRRQIALDPTEKEPLALLLPPLNSVAEVYWNGAKVGGIGALPPQAYWYLNPHPVAVPLTSPPGANSGVLAIRLWERPAMSTDVTSDAGFLSTPLLGYAPLIQQIPAQRIEHQLRSRMVMNACMLLFLFVAVCALVLWARSPSQWILGCVAGYFGLYAAYHCSMQAIGISWRVGMVATQLFVGADVSILVFLILLLADLPKRPGVRGFTFWKRASVIVATASVLGALGGAYEVLKLDSMNPTFLHYLDVVTEREAEAAMVFLCVLPVACFAFSRFTLPRLLFLSALMLDVSLGDVVVLTKALPVLTPLTVYLYRPLITIYGSSLSKFIGARLLLLLSIVYAVWGKLSEQLARQRFMDAEMRAAQEIQQVLVPAAAEREAAGYTVHSIYRPASEVGGDFFQIIPLQGDGTLIVAGDVSGKGLGAAMTVSLVVGTLRTLAEFDPGPAAILAGLNRRLIGRTQGGFVTCCAVRFDAVGHATLANAGHCQPYLDGRELDLPNGVPLGLVGDAEYEEASVDVSHGQQLTLLSDGVVEARNHHGELYGFDRLNELMQQRPTAERVADTAVTFGQEDDITVLTVTRLASA